MLELIMRQAFTCSDKSIHLEDTTTTASTSTSSSLHSGITLPFDPLKIELLKV